MGLTGHDPVAAYVRAHGVPFTPALRPKGVRKRANKACFRNALNYVMQQPDGFLYVEGLAVTADGFGPIHHAWVSEVDRRDAIDLTWREPGREYIGIAFTAREVARISLIDEDWWGGAIPLLAHGGGAV